MAVMTITVNNFEKEVLEESKPVIIDFWAAWCGPCRMLSPIVDEIAKENDSVKVGKINVDEENKLAEQFGIMTIPTLMIFKDGKAVATSVGVKSKKEILEMLKLS